MTPTEAIKELRDASDNEVRYGDTEHHYNEVMKRVEAFDMAIKALEQQPCEDCISREETIKTFKNLNDVEGNNVFTQVGLYPWNVISELPSVHPTRPTGKWIMPQQDDGMSDPIYYQVRCSECGFDLDPQTWHMELHQYGADKYCPNCGARMAESENKE